MNLTKININLIKNEIAQSIEPELKKNIRVFLQNLMEKDNSVRLQIEKLRDEYLNLELTGSYHDINQSLSGRFAHVNSEYYILDLIHKKSKTESDIQKLEKLYMQCSQIIQQNILNTEKTLEYSIYYKDEDGKILRLKIDKLNEKALGSSEFSKGITITRSAFAEVYAKELNEARKNQKQVEQVTQHYNDLKRLLEKGTSNFNKKTTKKSRIPINEGNIAEALERDLIEREHGMNITSHNWTSAEAWNAYRVALGNDPWYTGGDILSKIFNIQVKSFMSLKTSKFSGMITVTNFNTLEDILNYLVSLLNVNSQNLEKRVEEAYKVFMQKEDNTIDRVAQSIGKTSDELLKELEKFSNLNS